MQTATSPLPSLPHSEAHDTGSYHRRMTSPLPPPATSASSAAAEAAETPPFQAWDVDDLEIGTLAPVILRRNSSSEVPIPHFMIPCSVSSLMNSRYALPAKGSFSSPSSSLPAAATSKSPAHNYNYLRTSSDVHYQPKHQAA